MAYASLGVAYGNLGQASLAAENLKKAYELRERVSEREKFRISAITTVCHWRTGKGDPGL